MTLVTVEYGTANLEGNMSSKNWGQWAQKTEEFLKIEEFFKGPGQT